MITKAIVTGGSGYFGEILVKRLLSLSWEVINIDLFDNNFHHKNYKYYNCDIRDFEKLQKGFESAEVIFHCVAQVPLAKDKKKFWSVNSFGTENICKIAKIKSVKKLIYISSSAVFGNPDYNPITEYTKPNPAEDYGKAKLEGEKICHSYNSKDLKIIIIRPRTILGHGRLGIMQILFEWIKENKSIPVLDNGNNIYQFIHATDLVQACINASKQLLSDFEIFNVGTDRFSSMYELLNNLIINVKSNSKIRSIPSHIFEKISKFLYNLNLTPLGPYHHLMYGRSIWFDISKAKKLLDFNPNYSNDEMIFESYNHYLKNSHLNNKSKTIQSHHRSPVKKKLLFFTPQIINIIGKKIKK